jgi:hypothetical protein
MGRSHVRAAGAIVVASTAVVLIALPLPAAFGRVTVQPAEFVYFPDRIDYPTTSPPGVLGAYSVTVAGSFRNERLIAAAGNYASVTVWEANPADPVIHHSFHLDLPTGMARAGGVAFGRVLGNRRDDLVAVGFGYIAVFPRRGDVPAAFGSPRSTVLPHGTGQSDVSLADFDGDGELDAAVADGYPPGADPASVSIMFGDGKGTFSRPLVIPVGNTYETAGVIRVGYLNPDAIPDLVVGDIGCGFGGSDALVILGTGGGSFASPVGLGSTCDQSVTIGDLNRDGRSDIITANPAGPLNPTSHVTVFLGNGDGTFPAGVAYDTTAAGNGITHGDLNGDGFVDVAIAGPGGINALPGDGRGRLLPPSAAAAPSGPDYYGTARSLADDPVDLSGDDLPDLVVGSDGGITVANTGHVGPSGGSIVGGDTVVIVGKGFTPNVSVSFGIFPAVNVVYVSPREIWAVTPQIPRSYAGPMTVVMSSGLIVPNGFRSYVPQIGRLMGDDSLNPCTATVVRSPNHDVIVAAGHCVGGGGRLQSGFHFAPGYTGMTCQNEVAAIDFFNCGDPPPYGIWSAYRVGTNDQWLEHTDHALDYAFLDLNAQTQHIQDVVGGMKIDFNADRSQSWGTYGQGFDATGLLEFFGSETDVDLGDPGPPGMELPGNFEAGASGGPWIGGTSNAVSAVNSESGGGYVLGCYLGSQARNTFNGM